MTIWALVVLAATILAGLALIAWVLVNAIERTVAAVNTLINPPELESPPGPPPVPGAAPPDQAAMFEVPTSPLPWEKWPEPTAPTEGSLS